MSLCLPGYYGEMCSSAVPVVPVRGAGVGYEGSRPTCRLGFAILVGSDMLFLRRFSGEFAPFAFSQCAAGLSLRLPRCARAQSW